MVTCKSKNNVKIDSELYVVDMELSRTPGRGRDPFQFTPSEEDLGVPHFPLLPSNKSNLQKDLYVVEMLSEEASENKSNEQNQNSHLFGLVRCDPGGSLGLDFFFSLVLRQGFPV